MTVNIFYIISLSAIPLVLFLVYHTGIRYFYHCAGGLFAVILICAIADYHAWWLYGSLIASFTAAACVSFIRQSDFESYRHDNAVKMEQTDADLSANDTTSEELKKQIKRKEKDIEYSIHLYSIIKGLAETMNWENMVPVIGRALRRFLGANSFALYLTGEDNALRAYHRAGSWPARIILKNRISQPVMADPQWSASTDPKESIPPGSIAIPFLNKDLLFCMLLLLPVNESSKEQEELLEKASTLHLQLLFGMERAKLYHDIEIRSLIDGLTSLNRRQYFDMRLEEEISRAHTFRSIFSLIFLDIDHFKDVNDTYGHQTGDEVLARIGRLCKKFFYETDFCARYGGEEFAIICPRSEREGLLRKLENFRSMVEKEQFHMNNKSIPVTISFGVAYYPKNGPSSADVLAAADKALYRAKNAGRNRIEESE